MDETKLTYCKHCDKDTSGYGTYPAIRCSECKNLKVFSNVD